MSGKSGKRMAESGSARHSRGASSFPAVFSRLQPKASGLTLIELLITITILATLAAMFLGASNAAMESARSARTKTTINKIHTLLMERWGSYTTRRVDVDTSGLSGKNVAGLRLVALRKMMQLEMPDRWSDLLANTVNNAMPSTLAGSSSPSVSFLSVTPSRTIAYPSLAKSYWRRYRDLNPSAAAKTITDNQGAECLYMIIMLATGDGEARTLFSRQDIGDTDGDGAPEFLDGWGRPIHFLRWPAGFVNDSDLMSGDTDADHDPFDFFRWDVKGTNNNAPWLRDVNPAFRLVPLVYSAGPDGDPDLFSAKGPLIDDPYRPYLASGITAKLGAPMSDDIDPTGDGDNWHDNIHNHLQDNR